MHYVDHRRDTGIVCGQTGTLTGTSDHPSHVTCKECLAVIEKTIQYQRCPRCDCYGAEIKSGIETAFAVFPCGTNYFRQTPDSNWELQEDCDERFSLILGGAGHDEAIAVCASDHEHVITDQVPLFALLDSGTSKTALAEIGNCRRLGYELIGPLGTKLLWRRLRRVVDGRVFG